MQAREKAWSRRLIRLGLAAGILYLSAGCEGGNSSEAVGLKPVGSVTVTSLDAGIEGLTDTGAWVGLFAVGYLPHVDSGFADTLWADSQGRFAFTDVPAGTYNILVRRALDHKAAFLGGIAIPGVPTVTRKGGLSEPGGLQGVAGDSNTFGRPVIFMPGTPFSVMGDSLGRYSFSDIPAGEHQVIKSWRSYVPCAPGKPCNGIEQRRDSAQVRIEAGTNVGW